ncbi:MAG: sugar-binding protein [Victivallaceae bacterium]
MKIDGKLDEQVWRNAMPSPVFAELETGLPARYPVKARMLWDDQYLYIAFEVDDPNVWAKKIIRDVPMAGGSTAKVTMLKAPRGKPLPGTYKENFVKVYFDPDRDGRNYTEFHVTPINTVCDKWQETPWQASVCRRLGIKYPGTAKIHVDWDCPGLRTAVAINGSLNDPYDIDEGWTVEMAIPFNSLKILSNSACFPPRPGDLWRFHLGRRYVAKPGAKATYWGWPVLGQLDCHNVDRWAYASFAEAKPEMSKRISDLPKSKFTWRALWSKERKEKGDAIKLVELAKKMNCNVLIISTNGYALWDKTCRMNKQLLSRKNKKKLEETIKLAHQEGIKAYVSILNLHCSREYAEKHPELLQKVRVWEDDAACMPRVDPGRVNVHSGRWLNPDVGLTDYEKEIIQKMLSELDVDGLALDFVGYRNYYASFSTYSNRKRQEFADLHPEMTDMEILTEFSENSLVNYVEQVRQAAKQVKKDLKLAIHIYPDFDLNPLYGNRLPVEYCGQTIAWFYKPFWTFDKIYDKCMMYKNAEKQRQYQYNKFVPFIGVYSGDKLKSPERLRREIRIAGLAGNGTIILAFDVTFAKHPDLARVVAEEFKPEK